MKKSIIYNCAAMDVAEWIQQLSKSQLHKQTKAVNEDFNSVNSDQLKLSNVTLVSDQMEE